jgi:hypothetical protein
MMQLSNFVVIFLLVAIIWQAHVAGAAYASDKSNIKIQNFARFRSVLSIALAVMVVVFSWK